MGLNGTLAEAQGNFFFTAKGIKEGGLQMSYLFFSKERMAGLGRNFILNVGVCTE